MVGELLANIPDGAWAVIKVIAVGIVGAIGWFGKVGYDTWNKSRLPFKQDYDRFHAVINAINPEDLYYFREVIYSALTKGHVDGVDDAEQTIRSLHLPAYLNKKLEEKEQWVLDALKAFNDEVSHRVFVHNNNQNIYTIYWDNFDEWGADDAKRIAEIQDLIKEKREKMIAAFEDYRDYGNKLFSEKIKNRKQDG